MSETYFPDTIKVMVAVRSLIRQYYYFLSHYKLNARGYRLDRVILKNVVERYWMDVDRLHRYHNMTRIDRHKIAGYLTYWLCRLRPISSLEDDIALDKPLRAVFINELFAISVALGRLQARSDKIEGQVLQINADLLNTLCYSLRYRPLNGDALSVMYYLVEKTR